MVDFIRSGGRQILYGGQNQAISFYNVSREVANLVQLNVKSLPSGWGYDGLVNCVQLICQNLPAL